MASGWGGGRLLEPLAPWSAVSTSSRSMSCRSWWRGVVACSSSSRVRTASHRARVGAGQAATSLAAARSMCPMASSRTGPQLQHQVLVLAFLVTGLGHGRQVVTLGHGRQVGRRWLDDHGRGNVDALTLGHGRQVERRRFDCGRGNVSRSSTSSGAGAGMRPAFSGMALTNAERQRRFRERRAVGEPVRTVAVARTPPKDRRPRPKRWTDAVDQLRTLQAEYQAWRDGLPRVPGRLPDTAELLEGVCDVDPDALDSRAAAGVRTRLNGTGAALVEGGDQPVARRVTLLRRRSFAIIA